jgi:hypothetical protein
LTKELGARRGVAGALFNLGRVALGQGDYATAQALHQESFTMFKELDNKWLMALGLEELGAVVALQGQPTWAARLVGAAAALREATGLPPEPMERTNYERGIVYARNQLGEKALAKALAEGRMTRNRPWPLRNLYLFLCQPEQNHHRLLLPNHQSPIPTV